jgi:futalosine hydrolase
MSILIIAATANEIASNISSNRDVEIFITGVGCPIAIYGISKKLFQKKYEMVIQVGIGGTFSDSITLGDAVVIEKDCFADLGLWAQQQFSNVFDMQLAEKNSFPFEDGWLLNKHIHNIPLAFNIQTAITVNTINDDVDYLQQLQEKYNAAVETMEGAALHYACILEGVPFIQIRGISNKVGERDKSKWKIPAAIQSSNELVEKILNTIQ